MSNEKIIADLCGLLHLPTLGSNILDTTQFETELDKQLKEYVTNANIVEARDKKEVFLTDLLTAIKIDFLKTLPPLVGSYIWSYDAAVARYDAGFQTIKKFSIQMPSVYIAKKLMIDADSIRQLTHVAPVVENTGPSTIDAWIQAGHTYYEDRTLKNKIEECISTIQAGKFKTELLEETWNLYLAHEKKNLEHEIKVRFLNELLNKDTWTTKGIEAIKNSVPAPSLFTKFFLAQLRVAFDGIDQPTFSDLLKKHNDAYKIFTAFITNNELLGEEDLISQFAITQFGDEITHVPIHIAAKTKPTEKGAMCQWDILQWNCKAEDAIMPMALMSVLIQHNTPIHTVIKEENWDIATQVINCSPVDALIIKDNENHTPLYYAAQKQQFAIVKDILDRLKTAVEKLNIVLAEKDDQGKTLEQILIGSGQLIPATRNIVENNHSNSVIVVDNNNTQSFLGLCADVIINNPRKIALGVTCIVLGLALAAIAFFGALPSGNISLYLLEPSYQAFAYGCAILAEVMGAALIAYSYHKTPVPKSTPTAPLYDSQYQCK